MQKLLHWISLLAVSSILHASAIIDSDVLASLNQYTTGVEKLAPVGIIIFLKSQAQVTSFLDDINKIKGIKALPLQFMPAVVASIPKNRAIVNLIANHDAAAQISSNKTGSEELEASAQAILLTPSNAYPTANNWWQNGYTGKGGVVGLIDSGVAAEHPGLLNKTIIMHQETESNYSRYQNGVRSAHGTGAACIYAGVGNGYFGRELGMAFGASTILSGLAGEITTDNEESALLQTLTTLNWMLTSVKTRPTIINYSFGNGIISCASCTDWSGLAKIVDYIVNHEKIMWVKSAGNVGFSMNRSTMTSPADNYNALTVANMNPTVTQSGITLQTPDRNQHTIRYTSSRGPTLNGRRKPDITAPGNDTRTCAPDPMLYPLHYSPGMDYHDGYRLMGGTSAAAPHVGGAILLLQEAGIKNPMAEKALLLNSADAWTDSGKAGPDDPNYSYTGGHYPVQGSEWNPTYGWGYINMQQAFDQRFNIKEDSLTLHAPTKRYDAFLPVGGKVTLVHERRVGYTVNNIEWKLSLVSLAIYDASTQQLIAQDASPNDTVHQVSNCERAPGENHCSNNTQPRKVIIRVTLHSTTLDGSENEPFAIVFG